jgi:riboflavin kinase / FMN adenylyltransferase
MQRFDDMRCHAGSLGPLAVAIGILDGVHLGHQALLKNVRSLATQNSMPSAVLSFHPHPATILARGHAPALIESVEMRAARLAHHGIDNLIIQPFDREFSRTSAVDFVTHILVNKLNVRHIVVGENFLFGQGQQGDTELLQSLGEKYCFAVHVVSAFHLKGSRVSSSRIRRLIQNGRLSEATELLGRPYQISGSVVKGEARGTELGFPTANLASDSELLPGAGVYSAWAHLEQGPHPAVVNIGYAPTFGDVGLRVEAHLLDHNTHDLYGKTITLCFVDKIRNEKRFGSIDALKRQILADADIARKSLTPGDSSRILGEAIAL